MNTTEIKTYVIYHFFLGGAPNKELLTSNKELLSWGRLTSSGAGRKGKHSDVIAEVGNQLRVLPTCLGVLEWRSLM